MKNLLILFICISIFSCKSKQELANKSIDNESYLWTVSFTNGTQAMANQMTQTKYIFLSSSDDKNMLCNGNSFLSEVAYRELWKNDGSVNQPVWSLKAKNRETIKARQVYEIACGNEDAQFGSIPASKAEIFIKNYLEFQKALK